MKLQGIIFDVDGVIVDTEYLHLRAYNSMFENMGLAVRWSKEEYQAALGQAAGKKLQPVVDRMDVEDKDAMRQKMHMLKRRCYEEYLDELGQARRLETRPGVVRLMEEALAKNIRLGLATVSPREGAAKLLRYALGDDLLNRFTVFRTGYEVQRTKPAPDVYLAALAGLGAPVENTLAIEDSEVGLASATGAGLKVLITPSEFTLGQSFRNAHRVIQDLDHYPGAGKLTVDLLEKDFF